MVIMVYVVAVISGVGGIYYLFGRDNSDGLYHFHGRRPRFFYQLRVFSRPEASQAKRSPDFFAAEYPK